MDSLRLPLGKECRKCGDWNLFDNFYRQKDTSDGVGSYCRPCQRAQAKASRLKDHDGYLKKKRQQWQREKHLLRNRDRAAFLRERNAPGDAEQLERLLAYKRNHYRANREHYRALGKRWYEENRAQSVAASRRYYRDHKEQAAENARRWVKENRERVREIGRRRRAKKAGAEGSFTAEEWTDLLVASGNRCLCCGSVGPLEADHVIPLSKGGTDYISNIQCLCRSCNARKGTRHTDYR